MTPSMDCQRPCSAATSPAPSRLLKLESIPGICHVNGPTVHDEAQMPFGGVKASGAMAARRQGRLSRIYLTGAGSRSRPDHRIIRLVPGITKSVLKPILRDGHFVTSSRMRSNLLKHNNLMLRSERRERLEAWAASD